MDPAADLEPPDKRFAASALEEEAAVRSSTVPEALAETARRAAAEAAEVALERPEALVEAVATATWQSLSIEHEGRLGQSRGADLRGAVGME